MNLVQEILRLSTPDNSAGAARRLEALFLMMADQPGFQRAEVLRSLEDPGLLLVIHVWDDISDWQRFQASDAKSGFSAGRPRDLYEFVPCTMNWHSVHREIDSGGLILRREVILAPGGDVSPRRGDGVRSSQTFVAEDSDPAARNRFLRLTRRRDRRSGPADIRAIEDELYASILRVPDATQVATGLLAGSAPGSGRDA